jgi:hypothetical protein
MTAGVDIIATLVTRQLFCYSAAELTSTAEHHLIAQFVCELMTGECLKVLADHIRPVYALTFSLDGRWLGTGSGDGWMNIYSVKVANFSGWQS